jgi:hypothetical protein
VEALARAAPQLLACHADVRCDAHEAHQLLRNLGAFASVRVHDLQIWQLAELDETGVLALAADFLQHASLSDLSLYGVHLGTPAALQAIVDAVITCGLAIVRLGVCGLSPASAPALAQLLGGNALRSFMIGYDGRQLLDQPATVLLAQALRANSTLDFLILHDLDLWHDPAAASTLVGALVAHPSLVQIGLSTNVVAAADQTTAGAALGALVAADAPMLQSLLLSGCALGDAGLGPLVDALPQNAHLQVLICDDNDLTPAFVRDRLLPAVRANTSLRTLKTRLAWESAREAEAIVATKPRLTWTTEPTWRRTHARTHARTRAVPKSTRAGSARSSCSRQRMPPAQCASLCAACDVASCAEPRTSSPIATNCNA